MRYILFFLIFSWTSAQGQTAFNHRLENGQYQALGRLIYELDDSYLAVGRGLDTTTNLLGIYATEFDKNSGEEITSNNLAYSGFILFFNQLNDIIEIDQKPYFLFHKSDTIYLTSYDDIENTINIEKKIFSSVPTNSLFIYDLDKRGDDVYILAGHSTGENNLVLFKYNLLDDSLTETFIYDELGYMSNVKMLLLSHGNFLLTYRIYLNDKYTQYLAEYDSEGNQLWKHTHDGNRENVSFSFIDIGNGEYIIGGAKGKEFSTDPEGQQNPFLMKFDYDEKDVVKTSDFDIPEEEWFRWNDPVREIIPSHDSTSFLCVSKLYHLPINWDTLQSYGMIAKVDRDLNVIWRRNYAREVGEYADNELYDIIATSDGNYLAYGTSIKTWSNFPEEIPILSWAIKIDEDGKIIGDTTTSTVEWEIENLGDQISIFPNPVSDNININQDELSEVTYFVYDPNGKLEDEFEIRLSNTSLIKDVSHWSTGVKFISIVQNKTKIGNIRLIKL